MPVPSARKLARLINEAKVQGCRTSEVNRFSFDSFMAGGVAAPNKTEHQKQLERVTIGDRQQATHEAKLDRDLILGGK